MYQCLTILSEEIFFSNIWSKPPLVKLEAISCWPISHYMWEDTAPHLATTFFQVVVQSNKVRSESAFLQNTQPLFPGVILTSVGNSLILTWCWKHMHLEVRERTMGNISISLENPVPVFSRSNCSALMLQHWCIFILHEDPVPKVVHTFSCSLSWDTLLPTRNVVISGFW